VFSLIALEYFLVAKIVQTIGNAGYVKVQSYSNFPERFLRLKDVYIDFWGDKKAFYIEDVKNVKGKILIKFKNFDSLRDVQVLTGREIYVDEDNAITLPENHFFVHDLIGSDVIVQKKKIGSIADIIKGKANDVLVVLTEDKKEKLIPFVLSFIEKFDAAKKKLVLNISEDYLEEDED
jgi:16S rRNA processing protein RimM